MNKSKHSYLFSDYSQVWFEEMDIDARRIAVQPDEVSDGILICSKDDPAGYYQVRHGKRELLYTTEYGNELNLLYFFLDQYRDLGRKLPDADPSLFYISCGFRDGRTKAQFKKMMEIMIRPLNTYDDLLESMRLCEQVTHQKLIYSRNFTGRVEDWIDDPNDDEILGINLADDGAYRVYYRERGRYRDQGLAFYDVRHVYEYILNKYCDIVGFC